MYHPLALSTSAKSLPDSLSLLVSLPLCLSRSARLTADSSVCVCVCVCVVGRPRHIHPHTPHLLSTVGVKDLPSHKAPLLDDRIDCAHKCHLYKTANYIHTQNFCFGIFSHWTNISLDYLQWLVYMNIDIWLQSHRGNKVREVYESILCDNVCQALITEKWPVKCILAVLALLLLIVVGDSINIYSTAFVCQKGDMI